MRLISLSKVLGAGSMALLMAGLQSCGGVKKEAKIATAIQTLLADSVTAVINNTNQDLSLTLNCGTTAADGTLSYTIPVDIKNPADLAAYVLANPNDPNLTLDVTFSNCKIPACGDSLVLDGQHSKLTIGIGDLLDNAAGGSEENVAVTIDATDQPVTGVLEGNISFAYKLEAVYKLDPSPQLLQLEVRDSTPTAKPLDVDGTKYSGSEINTLSDGC